MPRPPTNLRFESVHAVQHAEKHHYEDDETRLLHVFAIASDGTMWCCEWNAKAHTQSPWFQMEDLPG